MLRTRDKLVCECGHEGTMVTTENDQPFSSPWETYKLEGFIKGAAFDGPNSAPPYPQCPVCGSQNVSYAGSANTKR